MTGAKQAGKHVPPKPSDIDWGRYGLNPEHSAENAVSASATEGEAFLHGGQPNRNELFHEDQSAKGEPWWKANFFLSEPVLFGTWDGVFTSCMIHLFGVIIFLRSGWIVGNAGIELSVVIVLVTVAVCTIAVLAGIGICERCHIDSGGIHFLLSHILGSQIGGAISVIYCFGQAVSCALHVMGFAESMGQLLNLSDPWLQRLVAIIVIVLLLGINIAGVKWVIRLQFALLIILLLAALDFAVGTFIRYDPEHGVTGYDLTTFNNNSKPQYMKNENWFTIFGVFFPSMTGVFAGINMSGDLHNPIHDVPNGTLTAIGTCLFLYLVFVLGLGSTCQRWALQNDYLIAEKASALGVMVLSGLYISSMSSCLGALYATPRIVQSMANDGIIPFSKFLGQGKGPNRVPVFSLIVFAVVTLIFILAGQVNTLAPIVTIPFLLTYASVEYAYFSMAMTHDIQTRRAERFRQQGLPSPTFTSEKTLQDEGAASKTTYGATAKASASDLDHLFPERVHHRDGGSISTTESPLTSPDEHSSVKSAESRESGLDSKAQEGVVSDKSYLLGKGRGPYPEISKKSGAWHSKLCNRWIAVIGIFIKLIIMFLVQWGYALAAILALVMVWIYIGQAKPGTFPGVTEFKLFPWLQNLFLRCIGRKPADYDHIVVTPMHPGVEIMAAQLTEENEDYAARERYHQSTTVNTSSQFQDFDSD